VPESRLARVGIVVTIVLTVLGLVLAVVVWRYPHSEGLPEFKGAAGSIDEIDEFDEFIRDHTGERARVRVTFPDNTTIRVGKESSSEEAFAVGDVRCDPAKVVCEHKYWYRAVGLRKNDIETGFFWVDAGDGWLLQGTYFLSSGTGTGGIQWRTLKAVYTPAP
jgi:hypothetical protein